jgi:hypothetical protein
MWSTRGEALKGGAILLTGTVAMPSFASMAQAEDAAGTVRAIYVKWDAAFNQRGAAALARLYLPDARVMPPRGMVATSRKLGGEHV